MMTTNPHLMMALSADRERELAPRASRTERLPHLPRFSPIQWLRRCANEVRGLKVSDPAKHGSAGVAPEPVR